jgi:hypothetical protein
VTLTAVHVAFTALCSVLPEPYSAAAAFRGAARAPLELVVDVMYSVSALYQIWTALARPMPVIVAPLDVGELQRTPLIVFVPLPSERR